MFDKTAVYEAEIAPLTKRLNELCQQYGVPYVCLVAYAHDGESATIDAGGGSSAGENVRLISSVLAIVKADHELRELMCEMIDAAMKIAGAVDQMEAEQGAPLN